MVGDTLKLALEVTPSENFGILPRNCFAVNIESGERYTLTDEQGCAIDESLFPQWSVTNSAKVQAMFRFRRHHQTTSPLLNDEIRQELVLMSGVESLAVSSIINVKDSMTSDDEDAVASESQTTSSICVKWAPLLIALVSFVVCSLVLLYLCSKKPKTMDLESEIRF
ncbi:hypothetical protein B9Z55_011426 [Caenorhabditis nigoni]|uniref:ZP domain-containing protein n=1 Tax=Caenorhabditis nigoni TaxID=1611254 RepID=A0A2G5UK19_9PELO|nr:hypothetical protein B9Z55_011426 [Caenorhabditis nigoni]